MFLRATLMIRYDCTIVRILISHQENDAARETFEFTVSICDDVFSSFVK
jgi:hypothetical protein